MLQRTSLLQSASRDRKKRHSLVAYHANIEMSYWLRRRTGKTNYEIWWKISQRLGKLRIWHLSTFLLQPGEFSPTVSTSEWFTSASVILTQTRNSVKSFRHVKWLHEIAVQSCWWHRRFYSGVRGCNEISLPRESMSSIPLVDCVITKPSLDYETIQHMVRGGDSFDVLL